MFTQKITFVVFGSLIAAACGDSHDHNHGQPDAAPAIDAPATPDAPSTVAVSIPFVAKVGGANFACGTVYPNIGTANSMYKGMDFRFFVSSVKLVPAGGGAAVPVTLTVNSNQDANGIALLDFENNTDVCQTGDAATYTTPVGTAPAGTYTGLVFDLGVPTANNHIDPVTSVGPLASAGMHWNWRAGYKFAKIEGQIQTATDPKPAFNVHLGSTGCVGPAPGQPPASACAKPNRPTITLNNFTLGTSSVVADIAPVLEQPT